LAIRGSLEFWFHRGGLGISGCMSVSKRKRTESNKKVPEYFQPALPGALALFLAAAVAV
jgi:hypothetical protein